MSKECKRYTYCMNAFIARTSAQAVADQVFISLLQNDELAQIFFGNFENTGLAKLR